MTLSQSDASIYFGAGGTVVRERLLPLLVPVLERLPPEGREAFLTGVLFSMTASLAAGTDPTTARRALSKVVSAVNDPANGLDAQHALHLAKAHRNKPRPP